MDTNMEKVIVGQHIHGISLNGLEYLLDDKGDVRYFDGIDDAKKFLFDHGFPEDDLDGIVFRKSCGACFRCGSPLFKSDTDGYDSQCFTCDEDFYSIEQETTHDEAI